ncbi:MAG: hypothetical protein LUB63_04445 [Oscillospiraceae bacterium]|nr:hypothetical protein [Oscillospiraceae bacterium]
MIRIHVSAVFQVRDGFSGRIVEGSQLRCVLDGAGVRPVIKPGGYLVFTNLPEGDHRLALQSDKFQKELVDFTVTQDGSWEGYVALKPAQRYFFRCAVTRLHLTAQRGNSPLRGQSLWLTPPGAPECRVAQTKVGCGCTQLRLYCKTPALLPLPGPMLIDDGADSEVVPLLQLTGETGHLASALKWEHSRSKAVLPAQAYRADDEGQIFAAFPASGTVLVYLEGMGEAKRLNLIDGDNDLVVSW